MVTEVVGGGMGVVVVDEVTAVLVTVVVEVVDEAVLEVLVAVDSVVIVESMAQYSTRIRSVACLFVLLVKSSA